MNILFLNYLLMLIEAWGLLYTPQKKRDASENEIQTKKKMFVILQCIQWILLSCLRSDAVGADTSNYARIFELHANLSWKDCFEYFKTFYLEGNRIYEFEPGFLLFEKLVSSIWFNQGFYKFTVAVIFMSSLGQFVYKNSDDPFLAFLLYSGLFYNMFSLTGYGQVLSVAIGILWSYKYIKQRKFFKFLILVLLGSTFHRTTLVFIVFYFISRKKITISYTFLSIVAIAAMIILRNHLFEFIKGIADYDEFGVESGFTQRNFLLLFTVLSILAIWRYGYIAKDCVDAGIYYNGLIMSAAMIPFAMVSPTSMRLVYDFAFMLMILVPKVYQSFPDREDRLIAYTGSILVFGYFIATKAVPYEFFWQAM